MIPLDEKVIIVQHSISIDTFSATVPSSLPITILGIVQR